MNQIVLERREALINDIETIGPDAFAAISDITALDRVARALRRAGRADLARPLDREAARRRRAQR